MRCTVLSFSLAPHLSLSLGGSEFDRPTNDHAEEEKEGEISLLDLKGSSNAATLSAFVSSDTGCMEEAAINSISFSVALSKSLRGSLSLSHLDIA